MLNRDDYLPLQGLKAWKVGVIALCIDSILIFSAYCFLDPCKNWFALIGLLTDAVGAVILAIPDLPSFYRKYFYGGQLEAALDALKTDFQGAGRITPSEDWYETLKDALNYHFFDDFPDDAWLEIDSNDNFVVLDDRMNARERVAFRNVEGRILYKINEQTGTIRRSGITLLLVGFLTQFIGYLLV